MGGERKPFLELAGHPVLRLSIAPFLAHPQTAAIAIALGEADLRDPPGWLGALDQRICLVAGGATRTDSVRVALEALPDDLELVAIHDAARPLVTLDIIDRCLAVVAPDCGAVAGWPAVDTLKEVDSSDGVLRTPNRDRIWHAHTPQVFPFSMAREAYRRAAEEGATDTDDSALVERIGGKVKMVAGSPFNLKITRTEDLALAEALLRNRAG
jgi:2-C-methyl-D-erythritol 4-phosphate cytidylyltransferase